MAWFDWPFILSSVFAQLAIGAFLILGLVIFSGKLCFGQSDRLHKVMPVFWLLLFAALTLREVNLMMSQVHSVYSFSTEAMMVTVFFVLALLYWFAEKALVGSDNLRKAMLSTVLLSGLLYLGHGLMQRSDQWLVATHFVATTLCGGALFAHAALVRAEHKVEEVNRYLPLLGAAIAVVCFVTGVPQLGELAARAEAHNIIGPFVAHVLSLGLLLAAVGIWLMPILTKSKPALNVMTFALGIMFISSYCAGVGY
ncbi:dimethyl sulfoxide reductase anchor subunit [Photobacterium sp. SDRW27]|uniref:DmsC/YnfH family molybdoenzyme membrane anchor subunit n=1 Tax=Photobacterium obscurum TaxID=2829490 RepID=UPI0022449A24|nr:DmsC/YnfH family molybdoenzyme membrane anchor subunit [Photobacterium obscurum]MCW8329289.1 dimethyl sulfoxide reductase anchor subunit [Photobacterium obscurum]